MALLTDTDLNEILVRDKNWNDKNDKLQIFPFDEECLTPIGYDLRVGNEYSSALKAGVFSLKEGDIIEILPRDTVLITTLETIGMPQSKTISGFIVSKVSKVSKGLSHISTTVDPDWEGPLLNPILNELLFPDYFDRNFSGPEWLHGNQCCQDQAIQAVTMPVFLTTLITMFI